MQQLILKQQIPAVKMKALINFLKIWDIDVELKKTKKELITDVDVVTLMSEKALSVEWNKKEEDIAWENL